MKNKSFPLLFILLLIISACKKNTTSNDMPLDEGSKEISLMVNMSSKSNSNVSGMITFTEAEKTVKMIAVLKGLNAGDHAIHIHDKADCSSSDGKSTGGHWNPTAQPHGAWGDTNGYHKGDIGNFSTNSDGEANITFETNEWCIGCGDPSKDIIGKAVIVHEGVDDFTSQPSGAAGARISCGGIIE